MRCAECGVEIGETGRFCPVCGAPAVKRSSAAAGPGDSPAGDAPDLAQWAHRAGSARFSCTRLVPGYDMGQVDAFLETVRDTFLEVRQPPLTADEVRDQKFSTTRPLRPGYDKQEVDVFLDEVEARLRPPPLGPRDLGELSRGLSRVVNPLATGDGGVQRYGPASVASHQSQLPPGSRP
jgi:DivIVA domain-containing protein